VPTVMAVRRCQREGCRNPPYTFPYSLDLPGLALPGLNLVGIHVNLELCPDCSREVDTAEHRIRVALQLLASDQRPDLRRRAGVYVMEAEEAREPAHA
jgi:hypothetical protein